VEDIAVDESRSGASVSEVDIADSDLYGSVDIKAVSHSSRTLTRAKNLG
jgi:hypothetical protein